jgi:chromate transporter
MTSTWSRVAALSFGGPAGQIAVMHRIVVEEKKWISEERFLHALNFCMLLPGPEAQQLATYTGWLMHGVRGGLLAGGLFILPGFVSILALSLIYSLYQETPLLAAVFFGLKPAVLAVVVEAVLRISKRVLRNGAMVWIAVLSFFAIYLFGVPFPVVVLAAGVIGYLGGRFAPATFAVLKGKKAAADGTHAVAPERVLATQPVPSWRWALVVSAIALPLWFGPLVAIALTLGTNSLLFQEGVFFSQAAVVTFGGAYSVLTYVAQRAVDDFGWLSTPEMVDGLGMAETTPGPLIMVVQFVGYMGGYHHPGPFSPVMAGVLASLVTTWVTFVPCFYWVFLGAPFIERLRSNERLTCALSTITAAVVGAVLNLGVWFAVHTLFRAHAPLNWGPISVEWPEWGTIDYAALAILAVACWLTFVRHTNMLITLAVSVGLGLLVRWLG